jgi:hypothetical protein
MDEPMTDKEFEDALAELYGLSNAVLAKAAVVGGYVPAPPVTLGGPYNVSHTQAYAQVMLNVLGEKKKLGGPDAL